MATNPADILDFPEQEPERIKVIRKDLRLRDEEREELERRLASMATQAIDFRGNWDHLHDRYWQSYLAKPENPVKEFPWPRANNFVAPMTTVAVDTLLSLFHDAMFSGRARVLVPDANDPDLQRAEGEMLDEYYFRYLWEKQISLRYLGNDWNFTNLIDGTSAVSPRWSKDRILRREDNVEVETNMETMSTSIFGQEVQAQVMGPPEIKVQEETSLRFDDQLQVDVHNMERVFIAPGSRSSLVPGGGFQYPNCPWYYVEKPVSRLEVNQMAAQGHIPLQDEETRKHLMGEVELTEREYSQHNEEEIQPTSGNRAMLRIYYMRLVLPTEYVDPSGETKKQKFDEPGGIPEEVVIWYWPKIRQISRIVPLSRMRPDGKRPAIDNRYTRLANFWYGIGVPAKIEQTQKLYTSALRQMIDFGTLQNKPWAFYEPATTGLLPSMQSIQPGAMIPVASARGVQIPRFQGNHGFWTVVENVAQQWFERLTSVTDFTVGRSPSVPNAPRTARGQQQMLSQANIAFSHMVALQAASYLELFRAAHALHRKNAPPELEFNFFDKASGLLTSRTIPRRLFRAGVDFEFQLNPNRELQTQKAQNRLALISSIPMLANDPYVLREAASDVWAAEGRLDDFNKRIWPQERIEIQQQQMAQQMGQQQPGQPPPQGGGMGPLGPQAQPEPQTYEVDEDPEDINVKL